MQQKIQHLPCAMEKLFGYENFEKYISPERIGEESKRYTFLHWIQS